MLLDNKVAIITGAGSGVGRASALRFAAEGARVVCADVNAEGAKETVRLVESAGGTAIAVGVRRRARTRTSRRRSPRRSSSSTGSTSCSTTSASRRRASA